MQVLMHVVQMGDHDLITIDEAADAFETSTQNIRTILMRNGLVITKCDVHVLRTLRSLKVIPNGATRAGLLGPAQVEILVRTINTDAAKAAYHTIYTAGVKTIKAEVATVQAASVAAEHNILLRSFFLGVTCYPQASVHYMSKTRTGHQLSKFKQTSITHTFCYFRDFFGGGASGRTGGRGQ
jgi:hypothetical protein